LRLSRKRDASSIKESSKPQGINSDLPVQSGVRNDPIATEMIHAMHRKVEQSSGFPDGQERFHVHFSVSLCPTPEHAVQQFFAEI
jgi:hypothetical protein